jgi:ATP-dependent Lhr-like helicase
LSAGAAEAWFAARGWQPFAFQREVWQAMAGGESGLLHATTGSGKTYAVWFGAIARAAGLGVPLGGARPTSTEMGRITSSSKATNGQDTRSHSTAHKSVPTAMTAATSAMRSICSLKLSIACAM